MYRQLWMIAAVWVRRPMTWLLAIAAVYVLVASTTVRHISKLRRSFVIPSEYGAMESVRLTSMSTLSNGEEFQRSARLGEVDTSVEGIDLTSKDKSDPTNPLIDLQAMDPRDPTNSLEEFSSLQQALANYPSVRWIRFDMDQIQHVSAETLSKLSELETIIIHDNQVTQADVDKLAEVSNLQMLVLETLDFRASLNALSGLPNLETLVLSGSSSDMVDGSLFRPEVLTQTHELGHLRRLVLMPQWYQDDSYFAGGKTPNPANAAILKENAASLLPGHPSLADLWLGLSEHERSWTDLAPVQAAMPDVNVRLAHYDEKSIGWAVGGSLAIVMLTWFGMMYNLMGHFSTPQRRVIPNYERPHIRFVLGFAALTVMVSTVAMQTHVAVAWLPAMTVSVLAVALGATLPTMGIVYQRRPVFFLVSIVVIVALFAFQYARPVLRGAIPAMEPALDHFLGGHQPMLAIVIAITGPPVIYWMVNQFTDYDRLNAEAGLPPLITGEDIAKHSEIQVLQRRGGQRAVDVWHSQLEAITSKPRGWLRDIRLDWMGEPTTPFVSWIVCMVVATVIAFSIGRVSFAGRESGTRYLCLMAVAVVLVNPLVTSIARRDVLPLELLLPNSRSQFIRRRTLSIATKFSYLFAAMFVYVTIVQYFCFHTLDLENTMRAAIVLVPATIAGTGLVLWGSSIRNVFAVGLLVMVGLAILTLVSFSLDFRVIDNERSGEQTHEFFTSPLFHAVSCAFAGLLLWTGYYRLSRCELARQ